MRAALVASCLRGALPPVDLRAVCLVRAMLTVCLSCDECGAFGQLFEGLRNNFLIRTFFCAEVCEFVNGIGFISWSTRIQFLKLSNCRVSIVHENTTF